MLSYHSTASVPAEILEESVAEEQIIKLLEEIRDLQKQHVENYKDALKNQQESIAIQKTAMRRQKIALIAVGLFMLGILVILAWSSH